MARTALDHAKIVLGAIITGKKVNLLTILLDSNLTETHFPDNTHRNIFLLLEKYLQVTGGVLTHDALVEILTSRGLDAGKVSLYSEVFKSLSNSLATETDFRWSIQQLKEIAAEKQTAEAITSGMEILKRGSQTEKGETQYGHEDARKHVLEKFADIDRELAMQIAPEGDSREEAGEIWNELKNPVTMSGIKFGIPELDNKVDGLQNGELDLVAGYTSSGKSTLASAQLAWSAAIEQGKNVLILTSETLRPQIRRRLLCRHSVLPMFGLEHGINSRDWKKGIEYLPADQQAAVPAIIEDYTKNPNYGKLVIVQIPRNATISYCEAKANKYQREFDVELLIIDSINLLKADRRFNTKREELAATLIEAKQLATTFADGRGVPVVSPWQVNRDSWKEAQTVGYYNSSALAETSEASSSTDVLITILEPKENNSRYADVKFQVAKNRDGETSGVFDVNVDYATSTWRSSGTAMGSNNLNNLLGSAGGGIFGGI